MMSSSQRFGDVDQSVPFDDPHLKQAGIAVQYAPALDDTANCQMLMSFARRAEFGYRHLFMHRAEVTLPNYPG
ncbi:MAG: hypothetical protein WBB98_23900 [Xanthobacteraceae bacterium]